MSDDDTPFSAFPLPPGVGRAIAASIDSHERAHARAESAEATAWRWVESLDGEALASLRYIVTSHPDYAFANSARWEAVCETLMRTRGIDPDTGQPFGAEVLAHPDAD